MSEVKDEPNKGKASWQAQVAFYLSLATAVFSTFQWWSGEREAKIKSSIDVGQKFIESGVLTNFIAETTKNGNAGPSFDFNNRDVKFRTSFAKFIFHMDYLAFLINHDLLYDDHLPVTLKCSIKYAAKTVNTAKEQGVNDIDIPEAEIYTRNTPRNNCPFL